MHVFDRSALLTSRHFLRVEDRDVADLVTICAQGSVLADFPLAAGMVKAALVEWGGAIENGAGVIVVNGGEKDYAVIDGASDVFRALIDQGQLDSALDTQAAKRLP